MAPPGTDASLTAARWPAVDLARGGALVAMVIYHLVWDLSFYGLIDPDTASRPEWKLFANGIAATFLALAGAGIALAADRPLDWPRVTRRLAIIAGAAGLVTGATLYAMPDAPVWFGILHCIALSSLLALPFRRAPVLLTLLVAGAVFALGQWEGSAAFNAPGWLWLGLGTRVPTAVDYVPLVPWFGCVLAGLAAMRLMLTAGQLAGPRAWLERWRPGDRIGAWLARLGRWTLPIYLLHQPVLMGALFLVAQAAAPRLDAETTGFLTECTRSCAATGGEVQGCRALCDCVAGALKAEGLWQATLANQPNPALQARIDAILGRCRR
jgi:uncharacterized membrane protein